MKFSIVIPIYNVEKYIRECLDSIVIQLKEDIEIILVDDGSTDKSGDICEEYKKIYGDSIRVFHKKNEGLLLTRRLGLCKASGEYIINCDSDDCMEPGAIEKLREIINKKKYDVIIYNMYSYSELGKISFFENIFSSDRITEIKKEQCLSEYLSSYRIVSMCTKCVKKSCFDLKKDYTSFARIGNGEDTLQSLEVFCNAQSFVYLNENLYDYRVDSGMTSKFSQNYFEQFCIVINTIKKNNAIQSISNAQGLIALKVFSCAGRAITQARYGNILCYPEKFYQYLDSIYDNSLFRENMEQWERVKKKLQKSHLIVLKLLMMKKYGMIRNLLKIKNRI